MGRLLLRSTKTPTFGSRIEVLFQDVRAVKLPTVLEGLTVRAPTGDEEQAIEKDTGLLARQETQFFVAEGSGYAGYVVAGVMVSNEDAGEYDDPSPLLGDV